MTSNLEVVQGKVFDIVGAADSVIAQWKQEYMPLKINGIDDKKGREIVSAARRVVKKKRIEVENKRKELKESALRYGQAIDKEANRIKALIEPIESHLEAEEKAVDDALEAIKQEAARKEAERIQKRIDRLEGEFGMGLFGPNYKLPFDAPGTEFPAVLLKVCTDEQYEKFCTAIQEALTNEKNRIAAYEKARKEEDERLARIAAEQEAERLRLKEITRKQEEEARRQAEEAARMRAEQEKAVREAQEKQDTYERKMRAEREALEAEKKRIADAEAARLKAIEDEKLRVENEAKRQAELVLARKEAAEKATKDAEEKIKREAEAAAEKERLAKIASDKKEARRPDKEKLTLFFMSQSISPAGIPLLKHDEYRAILDDYIVQLKKIVQAFIERTEAL